jgi:hypothetical protein
MTRLHRKRGRKHMKGAKEDQPRLTLERQADREFRDTNVEGDSRGSSPSLALLESLVYRAESALF